MSAGSDSDDDVPMVAAAAAKAFPPAASPSSSSDSEDDEPLAAVVTATAAKKRATASKAAGKPAKPKKVKVTQEEANVAVAEWFQRENKPTMPAALVAALGSRYSATQVKAALETLAAARIVLTKDIKKATVFYPPQAAATDDTVEVDVRAAVDALRQQQAGLEAEYRDLLSRHAASTVEPLGQVRARHDTLLGAVEGLRAKVAASGNNLTAVDATSMEAVVRIFLALYREWGGRRKLAEDIVDGLARDRRRADVLAELGLETDSPTELRAIATARIPQRFRGQ
jgi:hypothetical protein